MNDIYVAGVGMITFGKFPDTTVKQMAKDSVTLAPRADLQVPIKTTASWSGRPDSNRGPLDPQSYVAHTATGCDRAQIAAVLRLPSPGGTAKSCK